MLITRSRYEDLLEDSMRTARQSRKLGGMNSSSSALTAWVSGRARSFGFAFRGFRVLFAEPNAKIHAVATLAVLTLGYVLELGRGEWCLVALSIVLVLAAEAFNTAIEHLANAVSRDQHPLLGAAKDVSACAVLLTALGASVVGAIVFAPKLFPTLP